MNEEPRVRLHQPKPSMPRNLDGTSPADNSRNKQNGIRLAAIKTAVEWYAINPNPIADPDSEYAQGRLFEFAARIERWIARDDDAGDELEREAQGLRERLSVIRGQVDGKNDQWIDAELRRKILAQARVVY